MVAQPIIARRRERELLTQQLSRRNYCLAAVYGRRRVGKTYLIENTIKEHLQTNDCVYLCLTGNLGDTGHPISPQQS